MNEGLQERKVRSVLMGINWHSRNIYCLQRNMASCSKTLADGKVGTQSVSFPISQFLTVEFKYCLPSPSLFIVAGREHMLWDICCIDVAGIHMYVCMTLCMYLCIVLVMEDGTSLVHKASSQENRAVLTAIEGHLIAGGVQGLPTAGGAPWRGPRICIGA